jgi:hypothetical protein
MPGRQAPQLGLEDSLKKFKRFVSAQIFVRHPFCDADKKENFRQNIAAGP